MKMLNTAGIFCTASLSLIANDIELYDYCTNKVDLISNIILHSDDRFSPDLIYLEGKMDAYQDIIYFLEN